MSVREGLLALLDERPRNGHQLKTEFEAATGACLPLNDGQVYTTPGRPEPAGYARASRAATPPCTRSTTPAGARVLIATG